MATSDHPALTVSHRAAAEGPPLDEIALGELLRRVAAAAPDRTALLDGQPDPRRRRRWTYAEMLEQAEAVGRALAARFAPGEHVAIWAPNRPEWVLFQYGAALAGLVLVTVNPAYRAEELRYVLRQSRSVGIIHESTYRGVSLTALVEEVRPDLEAMRDVLCFDAWDELVADGRARPNQALPTVDPTTPCQIQYTSGTTGFAKGALLHHLGAVNAARYSAERAGFAEGDTWVNPIPLFHVGGGVLTGVGALYRHGCHVVVPAFDPGLVLELVEAERASLLLAVPTMLVGLLEHPDRPTRDCSSLRTVMSGSTVVPAELVRRTRSTWDCEFSILFGQTELHGVLTQTLPTDDDEDQATTLGIPLPHVEVKIADTATGAPVPIGMSGEICARGYQSMLGYFEMADATAVALDAGGWLHTGDLGSMDERGYLRITGRLKDLIIRGGENIHPREIEDLLAAHPAVAEVAVIGVADPTWGEQVGAVLRAADPAAPPTAAELFAYCREHLAPFKTPRFWYLVEEFPLTPSGKIQKFVLRDTLDALRPLAG
ncbi:MAG: AMP-binding protein [Acidimicrobiales bacterium]|nr:AMP-binding protein [Acidimicrobiales bacterium]